MPHPNTRRRKILPRRRSAEVPSWALRLRACDFPADDADVEGYWAWRRGGEVPGLPPYKQCDERLLRTPFRGGWGD